MKSEYLRPALYEDLYQVMEKENVLALRVAVETGLRIDDVLRLKWENFKNSQKFVFYAKKTGKKGTKHISRGLSKALFERNYENSAWVFPGRKRGKHRTRQAVWSDLHRAVEKMGISAHVSPHSARKTYAVELRKKDGLAAVQRELQHDKQATTMIYAFADLVKTASAGTSPPTCPDLEALAEMIARRVVELLQAKEKPQA